MKTKKVSPGLAAMVALIPCAVLTGCLLRGNEPSQAADTRWLYALVIVFVLAMALWFVIKRMR